MAKATITIKCTTCGKEFTVSKNCYNRTEANNWEHWAANHYTTCHECYAQKNQPAASSNLPELEGSEKQIAWATSIRAKFEKEIGNFVAGLEKMLEELKASGEATPAHTAHIAKCHKVMAKMLSETSCRWWIDNRTASPLELFDAEMANTEDEPAEEAAEEIAEETVETSEEIAEENTIETQENTEMTNETKIWYAVMMDADDNDWGHGSFDLEEAKRMVKPYLSKGGYIAVIDDGDDPVCIDEIRDFDEE